MTDPTTQQIIILAALWLSVSFLGGFLTHAIWLDGVKRRAERNEAEDAFMDAHLGGPNV